MTGVCVSLQTAVSGQQDEVEWYLAQLLKTYVPHANPHLRQVFFRTFGPPVDLAADDLACWRITHLGLYQSSRLAAHAEL